MDQYQPASDRYDDMPYRRVGRSGLLLPAISLGLWHNFGDDRAIDTQRATLRRAFDRGVTHFDLANNYGPPYGSAEINFGRTAARGLRLAARRTGYLDQGRLGHVARPLRRPRIEEVPHRESRPESEAIGRRVRRHLLPPPFRQDDAVGGDHGRPRFRRSPGQGPLRGHLLVLRPSHDGGGRGSCDSLGHRS